MIKKVFLAFSILTVIFAIGTISFGANAATAAHNTVNTVTGAIGNTVNHATTATHNTVNATHGATGTTGTGTATHGAATTRTATPNTNYTATRTAAPFGNMSATTWTWLIIGITTLIVAGLIWYFVATNDSDRVKSDNR